jgi:hypothetical protein
MNDWQVRTARVYMRGSRISDTILKKAGVPAKEKTMVETAAKAS